MDETRGETTTTATPIDPGVRIGHVHLKVADLDRATTLLPASSDVFATAALAHLCAGDRPSAIAALRRAGELAPGDARLRALLAEVQRSP